MPRSIGLIGKMGSGKNTVADVLIRTHGYIPLAFATPLKEMVIEADPLIACGAHNWNADRKFAMQIHLSDLLDNGMTFEECKREYPEVRRTLQRIGQGARKVDPDYWVRALFTRALDIPESQPVVITDVRYPNEADALRTAGYTLVRITRPVNTSAGLTMAETRAMLHESETALDTYRADHTINNDGTLAELVERALALV